MRLIFLVAFSMTTTVLMSQQKSGKVAVSKLEVVDRPNIVWLNYKSDTVTVASSVHTIETLVKSRLALKRVEVTVNGLATDIYSEKDFKEAVGENKFEQPIEPTVTLRNGVNAIVVTAENKSGIMQKSTRIVIVDPSKISVYRNEKDQSPPMIYVSNPANIKNDFVLIYEDYIKLTGTIIDEAGIQELKVNGIKTPVRENGAFVIHLPLNVGDNPITMEAKDVNQNIALKRFKVERRNMQGSEYNATESKNYLLVIGINSYTHWPILNNAVADATMITRVLTTMYKFNNENVTLLLNEDATTKNIYKTLREYIEKISANDNLLIYFSGHGYFDKLLNEGYWVPVDALKDEISGFIPNSQILKIIENINSQHTLLIADACFSGSLFASSTRGYVDNVEKYKSRWGLASGRLEVVSDGEVGQNSPFAKSLFEFLNSNTSSKVPASDLIQYVKKRVVEISNQTPIGNPLKNVGDEGGEFIFYKQED